MNCKVITSNKGVKRVVLSCDVAECLVISKTLSLCIDFGFIHQKDAKIMEQMRKALENLEIVEISEVTE